MRGYEWRRVDKETAGFVERRSDVTAYQIRVKGVSRARYIQFLEKQWSRRVLGSGRIVALFLATLDKVDVSGLAREVRRFRNEERFIPDLDCENMVNCEQSCARHESSNSQKGWELPLLSA
jgi:hypothetical protein